MERSIRKYLKQNLSPKRRRHSEETGRVAADLCMTYNMPPEKGMIAGLSHDISRELSRSDLVFAASVLYSPADWELDNWVLLHGKAGAATVRQEFGIEDEEILEAIALHTTGAPGMGDLAKIVYIADYIEPNRKRGAEQIRHVLHQCTLDEAFYRIVSEKLHYCRSVGKTPAPPTVELFTLLERTRLIN
jgi:nicotinate-nucleotide adenylyltransferase